MTFGTGKLGDDTYRPLFINRHIYGILSKASALAISAFLLFNRAVNESSKASHSKGVMPEYHGESMLHCSWCFSHAAPWVWPKHAIISSMTMDAQCLIVAKYASPKRLNDFSLWAPITLWYYNIAAVKRSASPAETPIIIMARISLLVSQLNIITAWCISAHSFSFVYAALNKVALQHITLRTPFPEAYHSFDGASDAERPVTGINIIWRPHRRMAQ